MITVYTPDCIKCLPAENICTVHYIEAETFPYESKSRIVISTGSKEGGAVALYVGREFTQEEVMERIELIWRMIRSREDHLSEEIIEGNLQYLKGLVTFDRARKTWKRFRSKSWKKGTYLELEENAGMYWYCDGEYRAWAKLRTIYLDLTDWEEYIEESR